MPDPSSDPSAGTGNQIRQLKVSAHTMALEPGLYCVYNEQGGPVADTAGFPGVRITPAPGVQGGTVQVSGFTEDGWIGTDSAALVRVTRARSDVLVTVYQAEDGAEAPKLQVVLLAPGTPAEAPAASPAQVPANPQPAPGASSTAVEVVAHVYGRGDVAGRLGNWLGEPGSQRWIEGFGVAAPEGIAASDIEYQAVLGRGWLSPWSEGGQFCGSRGMSLPILGMRIRLRGDAAKTQRIRLLASFVDGTQIGPVGDGDPCEAPSLAALEAFKVTFEPLAATEPKASRTQAATQVTAAKPKAAKAKAPEQEQVVKPKRGRPARQPEPTPEPIPAKPPARAKRQEAVKVPAELPTPVPAKAAKAARPATKPSDTPAKPAARAPAKRTPPTTRRR